MSKSMLPLFFSSGFMVSSLTFSPLIHFEFIFVHGVRECSDFILLHVVIQVFQHHLFKVLVAQSHPALFDPMDCIARQAPLSMEFSS